MSSRPLFCGAAAGRQKGKRALTEVRALDPELAGYCQAFLGAVDLSEQLAGFRALAAHVLAPLGRRAAGAVGAPLQKR